MSVEITQAAPDRVPALAAMLGRAFVNEPMMLWPLGGEGDVATRFGLFFQALDEHFAQRGFLWEAGDSLGAAAWVEPGQGLLDFDPAAQTIQAISEDGGQRWDSLWAWAKSMTSDEPGWFLDHIGVEPGHQGSGVGAALIEFGLARARKDGVAAFLESGNPRNVPYYERFGFRVVEDADAPDGGPHLWFMRWDP